MSLLEKKYTIIGWHNEHYLMTAKELFERVQEDSKSDYNWIASATELVQVCNKPSFPQEYAQAIKIAILNCFASLETKKEFGGHREDMDDEAVCFCYHTLSGVSEEADTARQNWLRGIIKGVTIYHFGLFEFDHYGPTYHRICDEWKEAMFERYRAKHHLNFDQLRQTLHEDFDKTMKKSEEEGVFEEDDKKNREEMDKIARRIMQAF